MDWIINLFRYLSFWIDQIIYSFISTVYKLFYDISYADIFNDSNIFELFASKIYAILGIFMLFKVTISILTYIVNPDSLMDKTKGFGNIIMKIITTFAMLILTPLVFTQLRDVQNIVLRENAIGRLFVKNVDSNNYLLDAGDTMAYHTLNAFYHFNYSEFPECEGNPSLWQLPEDAKSEAEENNDDEQLKKKCNMNYLKIKNPKEYNNLYNNITNGYYLKNVNLYMNSNTLTLKNEDDIYLMEYTPILSTIAGIAVCLLLLVFCFDIAVRNIKLGFLQIIAPIPIISRIDPNKGKDVFNKWIKSCTTTYLDVFIRLLAINFSIFVISLVIESDKSFSQNYFMVRVFIILGALLFAKELPNLIKELTGFDTKGTFTMNPLKKLNQTGVPMGLGAAGAYLASGIGGFASNYMDKKGYDSEGNEISKSKKQRLLSGLAGMSSAKFNTAKNIAKNKGKNNFKSMTQGITTATENRNLRKGDGVHRYGTIEKIQDYISDVSGYKYETGTSSLLKDQVNSINMMLDNARQEENSAKTAFQQWLASSNMPELSSYMTVRVAQDANGNRIKDADGKLVYEDRSYKEFKTKYMDSYMKSLDAKGIVVNPGDEEMRFDQDFYAAFGDAMRYHQSIIELDRNTRDLENKKEKTEKEIAKQKKRRE